MNKPNIVFILSDQHNSAVINGAGDSYVKTPNLDRLINSGVNFTNCYCSSPLCSPSRMSLMSGKLPMHSLVFSNGQTLNSEIPTFAHSANIAGYETVLSGRMHFYGADQYHGFEQRLVGDNTPIFQGHPLSSQNFGKMKKALLQNRFGLESAGAGHSALIDFDNDVTDATIDFLNSRIDERPLLLTIGLFAPHPPFIADKERFEYYKSILPDAEISQDFIDNMHPAIKEMLVCRDILDISTEDWRNVRAAYYALVEFLDYNIGRILEKVEETLGLENTVIIYASDHGEGMGINGLPWKNMYYDASAKVPLIISCPSKYKSSIITQPTSLLDVTQTIVSLSEGPELDRCAGMNLIPVLCGEAIMPNSRAVISQLGTTANKTDVPSAMIRKGKYKLVEYYGYELPLLFDMEEDSKEEKNLANCSDYKYLIEELSAELAKTWDPEYVLNFCEHSAKDSAILKQWSKVTQTKFPVMWKADGENNYIINAQL